MFVIYVFQGRSGSSGGGGAGGLFGFGKSTAKIINEDIGVRFK